MSFAVARALSVVFARSSACGALAPLERAKGDHWSRRLGALRTLACSHSSSSTRFADAPLGVSAEDWQRISLGPGSWRTIRGHVLTFERFFRAVFLETAFNMSLDALLSYC